MRVACAGSRGAWRAMRMNTSHVAIWAHGHESFIAHSAASTLWLLGPFGVQAEKEKGGRMEAQVHHMSRGHGQQGCNGLEAGDRSVARSVARSLAAGHSPACRSAEGACALGLSPVGAERDGGIVLRWAVMIQDGTHLRSSGSSLLLRCEACWPGWCCHGNSASWSSGTQVLVSSACYYSTIVHPR